MTVNSPALFGTFGAGEEGGGPSNPAPTAGQLPHVAVQFLGVFVNLYYRADGARLIHRRILTETDLDRGVPPLG